MLYADLSKCQIIYSYLQLFHFCKLIIVEKKGMTTVINNYLQFFAVIDSFLPLVTVIFSYLQLLTVFYSYLQLFTDICSYTDLIFLAIITILFSINKIVNNCK